MHHRPTKHQVNNTEPRRPDSDGERPPLRLVAWETTRNCNLSCVHCRASATCGPYTGELDTDAALTLLDQIARIARPIVILTGGEPLLRPDIFDIAQYGTDKGLRMVMAPNGTLVSGKIAEKMAQTGIKRISISLDGATAQCHDAFRGVSGAFHGALQGIENARAAGIEFQINTTITKTNLDQIPLILDLAERLGAVAHHIFLLVPTGRGKYIIDQEIDAQAYEKTLNWFYDQREKTSLQLKATCAPHYHRILRQRAKAEGKAVTFQSHGLDAVTRGCLAGSGFCFISHRGIVQPCGFLDLNCGDVTQQDFAEIWLHATHFKRLRDSNQLKDKCGCCEYRNVCGGCRARAYEATGDYLAAEPLCQYTPKSV
ncbi:MAG: heme b synthase [Desulfatitalea sp.]|nr:heme b synthase [Desulfatitalea sp.]NNK02331.1 heme b synthase [Desulfatitalea sp.]